MDDVRRLFEEGWGHTVAGYVTDYAIAVGAVICLVLTLTKFQAHGICGGITQLIIWQVTTAVAFGPAGVAHHLIDTYYTSGESMGFTWSAENSGWMYPWLLAMISTPIASAALLALELVTWSFAGAKHGALLVYIIGCMVALYEAEELVLYTATDSTGNANVVFSLVSLVVAIVMMLVGSRQPAMLIGAISLFIGYCILSFAPAGCKDMGEERDCPFPEDFNQNAVFHTFVLISVFLVTIGAWAREKNTQDTKGQPLHDGEFAE